MMHRNAKSPRHQVGIGAVALIAIVAVLAVGYWIIAGSEGSKDIKKAATLKSAEVIGNLGMRKLEKENVAGGFHKIPVERKQLADNVFQVKGVANTHLIKTSEGNVVFDTGLVLQSAKQLKLLKEVAPGPVPYVILSHSHADHIGGAKFWIEDGTKVVTHREYEEEQRYLTHLEPYLHNRNRILFPWIPEKAPDNEMLKYGGVEPDITVGDESFKFELGGTKFEVIATPGAEGADNIVLWLPEQKILFSGDFFGPLWPQFPNIFTMRGEKVRKPVEYINSLNKLIALQPEMIVPSHHDAVTGKGNVLAGMVKMRDAVKYVHDQVIDGMNSGKTVHELMAEVALPPELDLTQEHGKVSWAVKSIWEYYATWFHFDTPTELYSVPARDVYGELAAMAGTEALLTKARQHLDNQQPERSLHFLEITLEGDPGNTRALELQLQVFDYMLTRAKETFDNNYEKDYLRSQIRIANETLGRE